MSNLANDTRVFEINPAISVQNVTFKNRFGFTLAGHLYVPSDFDGQVQYAAIAISGPFGAVKEQASGLYAQTLAENGFVTLAFDPSTTGESSGSIRNMPSPDVFTEDYSAAVDFLGMQSFVDRQRIGALGICGLGSHVLSAASVDVRIKAVATSAMYDMSESMWQGLNKSKTAEQRAIEKQYLADLRWQEAEKGQIRGPHELNFDNQNQPQYVDFILPDELPAGADPVTTAFFNYYKKRAFHFRSVNSNGAWDALAPWSYYNFSLQTKVEEIVAPKLLITGTEAHSRYMSEESFARMQGDKELIVVEGADHVDLYDQMDKIPFAKLADFYQKNLR